LAGAASVANYWITTNRVAFMGDRLQADYDAQSYAGRVEAGWRLGTPRVAVTPYVAGVAQRFSTPNYKEADLVGGGFALQFNRGDATELRGEAGARLESLVPLDDGNSLLLYGRGAWAYNKVTDPGLVAMFEAALMPGGLPGSGVGFTVNGAVVPKSSALASAGAEFRFASHWSLLGNFRGEFGGGAESYSGTGAVRYNW
jgi:outer membrane autotransporter protein